MALLMEPGSEPKTESEIADFEAIAALKESTARELKEQGNQFVKMGKKHYSKAIDCYTRAIDQKALRDSESSLLFSNRAHVNLMLGNYRRALTDAQQANKLRPANVKAFYRAAKASLALDLLTEAKSYCEKGIENDPSNEELRKLLKRVDIKKSESDQHQLKVSGAVEAAKALLSAFETRKLNIGKALYQELTGVRKPVLDRSNILHWPVLLLYAEVMSSDFIEDFCETDMFSAHLDMMFSESSPPLPWDAENSYTREAVEVYYEAASGVRLSKTQLVHHLLDGTAAANEGGIIDEEGDADKHDDRKVSAVNEGPSGWVRVNEKRTLHDVLKDPNFIIPGIPVFVVVSKRSHFYKEFKVGKWTPPS